MPIASDFSVAVNKNIRHVSGTDTYTVLELHRFLQGLADDASSSGDDLVDITSDDPSGRSTDTIIELKNGYNIDDDAAEYFYGGSISQDSGNTVYSGLQVLGAVANTSTQLMVEQDNEKYQLHGNTEDAPFWGDQSSGGFNGSATSGILMRCLIKSRSGGVDINGKRIRVIARHWGDTYDFFNVTLGDGEAVAAIGTVADAQNDTARATVTAYGNITNVEGFQTIDVGNGNGAQEYYSQWQDTSGSDIKAIWEWGKDLVGHTTSKTIHGINGLLFQGITHSWPYDGESGGPFTEDEIVAWGTSFAYDGEASGPFTEGESVTIGSSGAGGKLVYLQDDGSTGTMYVQLDDTSITLLDNDVVTGLTSGATCSIQGAITGQTVNGGSGLLLALDDDGADGNFYIQLLSGQTPANNDTIIGRSSDATCLVNGTPTLRTVPKTFLGTYTGSLIGAYGVGVASADLTASDTIEDLAGATQTPPNNVTFTVTGLVSGEDYVLVGPSDSGVLDKDQLSLNTTLNGATETAVVATATIPSDTPTTGSIRIELDTGVYMRQDYTSYASATFTIASADFTGANVASSTNDVFISYIDVGATSGSESFTSVYNADRSLYVRVRDGGASPIKSFETEATLTSVGGSVAAIRTSDA